MTVTELSKLTGYAISTVSKALSDSSEISPEAKEKILKVARETGYYDKALRRKKRIGAPKTVGIITDDFSDARIIRNLCRELEKRGVSSVVSMCQNATELLSQFLCVDSVLFMGKGESSCAVPSVVFDGDVEKTVELLCSDVLQVADEPEDENFSATRKKDDIWLF